MVQVRAVLKDRRWLWLLRKLCVLIEGLAAITATSTATSTATRAVPGPQAGGRQSSQRANAGGSTGESQESGVPWGMGTRGRHICAWGALFR